MVAAADPTANVVTADGSVGISTTSKPFGGRATTVRPWASTLHVDERSITARGCSGAGAAARGGTVMTITLAIPRSAAASSGRSATTPPSINMWPSTSTGGNTPGNAELATIATTTSPDSRMNGRPVAR